MQNQYDRRAEEAERLAQTATSEEERRAHEEVAKIWRELADRKRDKDAAP